MPEWLRTAVANADQLPPMSVIAGRIVLAVLVGFVIAGVYRLTIGRRNGDARTLPTTLALLCVLLSLVTVVIGDNVARAFGLVGALSIVRFRTIVEDTRDTAFVIFAVVIGMAVGAGYALVAAIGIPAVAIAALIMCGFDRPTQPGPAAATLTVRVGLGHDPQELLGAVFPKYLSAVTVIAVGTARQGAALEVTYAVRLRDPGAAVALVAELNKVEGVQGVELRP